MTSIAAPLRDQSGRVVASINAVMVDVTRDEHFLHGGLKDRVLAAAAAISAMLGAPGEAAKRFGT